MNILWLSWRDHKNPNAGGAEKFAFEICTRLARDGNHVTLFSSRIKGTKRIESTRNLKIIRGGNLFTCRIHAFFFYLKNRNFDLVIDEINTIPFFSIFYAKRRLVLIHQLAKEYWFRNTFFPINFLGYYLESLFLLPYKNTPTITVSDSTRADLKSFRFRDIRVVKEGLDIHPAFPKNKANLVLFIGRLLPAKKPQDAILAFEKISLEFPNLRMIVVGKGKRGFIESLKNLRRKLKLNKKVKFSGYVDEKIKRQLLKDAKIILIPSIREGWGLVATEAQSFGCVPVAYNVPGLRDSIKNQNTGLLVASNPKSLAKATINLLKDKKRLNKIAAHAYKNSLKFNWENSYQAFKKSIKV